MRTKLRLMAATAAASMTIAGAAAVTAATAPAANAAGPCGSVATAPTYKHVIWIFMENYSFSNIIGSSQAPYENSLASECGLATNYHNISHPSLPNYLAATSGLSTSIFGGLPWTSYLDCNPGILCETSAPSIFGQGESWKAYEESMPSNCDKSDSGEFAARHDPPAFYTSLSTCSTFDVPYTQLATDLANNSLPAFSFITPNLIDDMHDGTIADGDNWLKANLPTILNSSEYTDGSTAVFITWDEGENGSYADGEHCATNTKDVSCHVATLVISPSTAAGTKSGTLFNHYSLLATAEQLLGLPKLGKAATATSMVSAFNL
jgi:phosphatidylinositol-3-phosphatase